MVGARTASYSSDDFSPRRTPSTPAGHGLAQHCVEEGPSDFCPVKLPVLAPNGPLVAGMHPKRAKLFCQPEPSLAAPFLTFAAPLLQRSAANTCQQVSFGLAFAPSRSGGCLLVGRVDLGAAPMRYGPGSLRRCKMVMKSLEWIIVAERRCPFFPRYGGEKAAAWLVLRRSLVS